MNGLVQDSDGKVSSMILSQAALSAEEKAARYRSLSIVLGTTTAGGLLFSAFTVFGR